GAYTYLAAGTGLSFSTTTLNVATASESAAGIAEFATLAEVNAGTDTTRTVRPSTLAGWTGSTNIVSVGALNAGSITSGFGNINIGSSTLTAGTGVFSGTVSGADAVNADEFATLGQVTGAIGDASHAAVTVAGQNYLTLS